MYSLLAKAVKSYLSETVVVNGKDVILPWGYRLATGGRLPTDTWMFNTRMLSALLETASGAFLDVGFHLGQTLVAVKADQTYYGFEPSPECHWFVNELIRANGYSKCTLVPAGLWDENDLLTLWARAPHDICASVVPGFRDDRSYVPAATVPVYKGDYLVRKLDIGPVGVLKIDVEGAELEVIRGLSDTLSAFRPYILCEILPIYDPNAERGRFVEQRQRALEAILKDHGYEIHRILPSGELVRVDLIEVHSDLSLSDYLLMPIEKRIGSLPS